MRNVWRAASTSCACALLCAVETRRLRALRLGPQSRVCRVAVCLQRDGYLQYQLNNGYPKFSVAAAARVNRQLTEPSVRDDGDFSGGSRRGSATFHRECGTGTVEYRY